MLYDVQAPFGLLDITEEYHLDVQQGSYTDPRQREKKLLLRASEGCCFLVSLRGSFAGEGERVWIDKGRDSNGTEFWFLNGHSDQVDVEASARCAKLRHRNDTVAEADASDGPPP